MNVLNFYSTHFTVKVFINFDSISSVLSFRNVGHPTLLVVIFENVLVGSMF